MHDSAIFKNIYKDQEKFLDIKVIESDEPLPDFPVIATKDIPYIRLNLFFNISISFHFWFIRFTKKFAIHIV